MQKYLIATGLLLTACAAPQDATKTFYVQEGEVAHICLAKVNAMPPADRLAVNPKTGRSPFSDAAWCYSNQIKTVVQMTSYPHGRLVDSYADYLVRLTAARDRGVIDVPTTLQAYSQSSKLFRQSIASADARLEADSRRELASRISVFAAALANVAAEQDRQRAANRPVTCFLTGVYVQNAVVCN